VNSSREAKGENPEEKMIEPISNYQNGPSLLNGLASDPGDPST
jgi:hypothetical protein